MFLPTTAILYLSHDNWKVKKFPRIWEVEGTKYTSYFRALAITSFEAVQHMHG